MKSEASEGEKPKRSDTATGYQLLTFKFENMKLLEEKNRGYWRTHEAHIRHYALWVATFRRMERENDRKGYTELSEQCRTCAEDAKRELKRVLTGNI